MVVEPSLSIVPPPRRSHCTKDRKRQHKKHRQARAIPRACDQVHAIPENARLIVAQIILAKEARQDPAEQDACLALVVGDEASVLDELGLYLVYGERSDTGRCWG